MLSMSCCDENNASISSSTCLSNNVEEPQHLLEQDMELNGASSNSSPSSSISHFCFMARDSKVSSPLEPSTSCDDDDVDYYGLQYNDANSLKDKGEIGFCALPKGSKAISTLCNLLTYAIKSCETIEEKGRLEREYVDEIASLTSALEEEQEHRTSLKERLESLDESNDLIIAKIIKERDHA